MKKTQPSLIESEVTLSANGTSSLELSSRPQTAHCKLLILVGVLMVFVAAGCGSGGDSSVTPAQEAAMRHPVADPSYKGPDAASQAKMGEQIASFQEKHKNDKVEFTK